MSFEGKVHLRAKSGLTFCCEGAVKVAFVFIQNAVMCLSFSTQIKIQQHLFAHDKNSEIMC